MTMIIETYFLIDKLIELVHKTILAMIRNSIVK